MILGILNITTILLSFNADKLNLINFCHYSSKIYSIKKKKKKKNKNSRIKRCMEVYGNVNIHLTIKSSNE